MIDPAAWAAALAGFYPIRVGAGGAMRERKWQGG